MTGLEVISALGTIGSFGLGIYANSQQARQYQQQANSYALQSRMSAVIGAQNKAIAQMSGIQQVQAIAKQTASMIENQRIAFCNRGIDLAGSPALVMSKTKEMGNEEAQRAWFNTTILETNIHNQMTSNVASAQVGAMNALYGKSSTYLSLFDTINTGVKTAVTHMQNKSLFDSLGGGRAE